MKKISIKDLKFVDFDVKGVKGSIANFPINIETDYLSEGRQRYLLHMLTDGTRIYRTDKECITVSTGTIVFLPDGMRYHTSPVDVGEKMCKGLSVIFDMIDSDGNSIDLNDGMIHTWQDHREVFKELCTKILNCTLNEPDNILKIKSLLLRLIIELTRENGGQPPEELVPALEFISATYKENLPVKQYADKCHMSESYFRKRFTEYAGRSPIQYRNELRFAEARRLYSEGASINTIACELGFFDAGYFSKLYKKCNGHSLRSEMNKDMI
ncbi:MAG: helix-turn-helix transcriptional regulator [Clostridia bacterium]|nr:helix-turn-helix transcriptional regulator [Clostridia bacterium]